MRPAALLCAALLVCSAVLALSSRQAEAETFSASPRKSSRQKRSHKEVLALMPRKDVYSHNDDAYEMKQGYDATPRWVSGGGGNIQPPQARGHIAIGVGVFCLYSLFHLPLNLGWLRAVARPVKHA